MEAGTVERLERRRAAARRCAGGGGRLAVPAARPGRGLQPRPGPRGGPARGGRPGGQRGLGRPLRAQPR
eukprot:9347729-Lingulodinium_polyedra.AAC.1